MGFVATKKQVICRSSVLIERAVACVSAAFTRENVVARQENRAKWARNLILPRTMGVT